MTKVFIDGAEGTTGLEIRERLAGRGEFSLIRLDDAARKDPVARADALNAADAVILCLPDDAARQAVSLIQNPAVRVVDASSAHRTAAGWVYGFAELEPERSAEIAAATRVSNPGCYATGFLALMRPLTRAGIVPAEYPVTINAVSGYSGGGKKLIEAFSNPASPAYVETVVRAYGFNLRHKHVPEMQTHAHLAHPPVMAPVVCRYYRGMIVEVPLHLWALPGSVTPTDVHAALADSYAGAALIDVAGLEEAAALSALDAECLANTDRLKIYVFSDPSTGLVRLAAVLDNLGKGAGGAAVQNLNILSGLEPTAGLR